MRVKVARPGELGPGEAEVWAKCQRATAAGHTPFLSLTFARAVDAARPSARVAVVEDGGEITAFLPFERGAGGIGKPIGDPVNDLQGLLTTGAPVDARRVVKGAGLRGWRFIAAPAGQAALAPHHYEDGPTEAPVISLAEGYEAYLQGLSSSLRSESRRKRRGLERQFGPVRLEWNSTDPAHLRKLIEWKSGKYHSARELFSGDPTVTAMMEGLAHSEHEDCRGAVNVLLAGDRPVAVNIGLLGPRGLTGWSVSYDRELGKYSPGTMLVFAIAEEAAARGIPLIDLGYGQDRYKFSLANDSLPLAGGAVWVSRAEKTARHLYRRLHQARAAAAKPASPPGNSQP